MSNCYEPAGGTVTLVVAIICSKLEVFYKKKKRSSLVLPPPMVSFMINSTESKCPVRTNESDSLTSRTHQEKSSSIDFKKCLRKFKKRLAGRSNYLHGRPAAHKHTVGDPCFTHYKTSTGIYKNKHSSATVKQVFLIGKNIL